MLLLVTELLKLKKYRLRNETDICPESGNKKSFRGMLLRKPENKIIF